LTLFGGLLFASCGSSGGGGDTCVVSGVTVSASPSSVAANTSTTLTATVNASSSCSTAVTWSASPTGGTLTPNGLTATFTAANPGSYTITATSTVDPSKSGSTGVTVAATVACGDPNGTVVTHSTNISANETWAGDGVTHQVPNNIAINGATVTVQPCALVSLAAGASITLNANGHLLSAGTGQDRFITFQRADPNQAWGILRVTDATALLELHFTVLQGSGAFGGQYNNPAIAATGPSYGAPPAPMIKVDNVLIDAPQGIGVYLDANAAFTPDSEALVDQGAAWSAGD
jgi:hypothetical protein